MNHKILRNFFQLLGIAMLSNSKHILSLHRIYIWASFVMSSLSFMKFFADESFAAFADTFYWNFGLCARNRFTHKVCFELLQPLVRLTLHKQLTILRKCVHHRLILKAPVNHQKQTQMCNIFHVC